MPNLSANLSADTVHLLHDLEVDGDVIVGGAIQGDLEGDVDAAAADVTALTVGTIVASSTVTLPTAAITTLNLGGILTGAATSPAQFTANQTDFSGAGATLVSRWSSDASRDVFSRTGSSQQAQIVLNVGTNNIRIMHDDGATGTAALRFKLRGATHFTLVPDAAVLMYYDATSARWRLAQL